MSKMPKGLPSTPGLRLKYSSCGEGMGKGRNARGCLSEFGNAHRCSRVASRRLLLLPLLVPSLPAAGTHHLQGMP